MSALLKNILGGGKQSDSLPKKGDSDFADFAGAPDPVPQPIAGQTTLGGLFSQPTGGAAPFTKWYNIHERHSISEFKAEGAVIVVAFFIFLFHIFGSRTNRSRAKSWIKSNAPVLNKEFALVGFNGIANSDNNDSVRSETLIKEKSLFEFTTYATGRQNVAFMDVKITLSKKFNPFLNIVENAFGFFMQNVDTPEDIVEIDLYPFDGKEDLTVPQKLGSGEGRLKETKSTYDGFVWAIVNKERMQKLRDDRYDVSITSTKDNSKLPAWLTIMSENAEVTNTLLTQELIDIISNVGDVFDYLIVTDQPTNKPTTLEETAPRKRLFLKYHLPKNDDYSSLVPLLSHFVRLPDYLVQQGHFRPEVMKKIRVPRDAVIAQVKKFADEEKAEERLMEKEKLKKSKRDAELKGLDAKAQKRYLEKEKEKEIRKSQKKSTVRG